MESVALVFGGVGQKSELLLAAVEREYEEEQDATVELVPVAWQQLQAVDQDNENHNNKCVQGCTV